MAALGAPQTRSFFIGTAELRLGDLTSAGKLAQATSVGLIDEASLSVEVQSQDLLGGFPALPVDTAVTGQNSTITATLREYSRRNLQILLGAGVSTPDSTDVKTAVTTSSQIAAGATSIPVSSVAGISPGDIVGIAVLGQPELVTISRVNAAAASTVTLDTGLGLVAAVPAGSTAVLYKIPAIAVGNLSTVNYFSASLIFVDRATSRPVVFNGWKATVSSGLKVGTNSKDFASTDLTIKLLVPPAVDYAVGGPLNHLANIIPTYNVGMFAKPSDAATTFS